ncbi:MAG TPA: tetratricopeptide repeat protein [Pyrinomonadaceae bacterium]
MARLRAHSTHALICAAALCVSAPHAAATTGAAARARTPAQSPQRKGGRSPRKSANEAARLVGEGVAALERDERARARELFERALQIEPSNSDAHTYLGALADQSGDLAAAERHFAAAARAAPASAPARNNHGAALMRLGRTREAAREFAAALRLDAGHAGALVNLAQIRFAAGTPDGLRAAYELLERARAAAPGDAEIARSLLVTALRLGERAAVARHFRDYTSALARASAGGGDAAAVGTGASALPSARAELGAALLEGGFAEEAAEELAAGAAGEPSKAEYIVMLARSHMARKDVKAAGRALEGALARGLEAAPIYAALAEVYEASGHVENAIPAMRLAIERDPRNESYRFRYGMLLTDTHAPAAAVVRLEEALKEFPRSSRLWFALGVAQAALNRADEAAKSFERARDLDPKFAPALAYLGMTHDVRGRFAEAVELYERALALDDRLAAAHYLAAEAILKQAPADETRAEPHLKRAVELDPRFAPARVSLAKIYMRGERFEETVAQLQSAVAADPALAAAHYQLGRALLRLKRNSEGQAALAEFKRLSEGQREQAREGPREIMRRLANVRF